MATESPLKSLLPAIKGSAAPPVLGALACVSVSAVSALTRLRLCAPLAASCRSACIPVESFPEPAPPCACCAAAREASIKSKLTAWSRPAPFKSASCEPTAKAANWVRIT
jgi:hypothetical protein